MSRALSKAAWPLAVVSLAMVGASFALSQLNHIAARNMGHLPFVASAAFVGGLLNWRRPKHLVGWLFTGSAFSFALLEVTGQYATYGLLTRPGAVPLARALSWPQSWLWVPGSMLIFAFLPLIFPNGRLVSRHWRWVAITNVAICILLGGLSAVRSGGMDNGSVGGSRVLNPLGVTALDGLMNAVSIIAPFLVMAIVATAAAGLFSRFRRSTGLERQQMKWFTFAIALFPVTMAVDHLAVPLTWLWPITLCAAPVAATVAIFHYRLYDIDWLIDKTLVYIPLTAILAGLYSASTTLFQRILISVSGETSVSAVVMTTLVLVAAFTPIKNALQAMVDRRYKPGASARPAAAMVAATVSISSAEWQQITSQFQALVARLESHDNAQRDLRLVLEAQQHLLSDVCDRLSRLEQHRATELDQDAVPAIQPS